MEGGTANGTTMQTSATHSVQKKEEKTSNNLRNEVLKMSGNELREENLSALQYKRITKEAIVEKLRSIPGLYMNEYKFDLEFEVDEEAMEKARNELRETPDIVKESLAAFREMTKGDPDLIVPDHDEFYAKYLRPCKWYPKSAFHLMQRFFQFHVNYPHIVENLTPMAIKKAMCADIIIPLPHRCKHGGRIVVIHGGYKWKPKEVSLNDMFRSVMVILEGALLEPKTQICGAQVIIDMEGLSLSQVTYFTPRFAAMVVEWVQKCLPCRLKNIHIINQPFIFNMVFAIFKPFLSEKLRKRIHFHGTNKQNLVASIGGHALPKKYGGELNLLDKPHGEDVWKYFASFQEEYEDFLQYGYLRKK